MTANEFGSLPWDAPKSDPLDGDLFAPAEAHRYRYLGGDGRCIVGRGSMLVIFAGETRPRVVLRRRLRIVNP